MNVLVYLVPMALGLGLIGLFAFLWSLRSGQYEDLDGAAIRVLDDDDLQTPYKPPTSGIRRGVNEKARLRGHSRAVWHDTNRQI